MTVDKEREKFIASVQDTVEKLKQVSPTFCIAKWKQVTLHLQNGQTHSCHHPTPHLIPLDELAANPAALHNTSVKIQAREQMLKGEKPRECDYCWKVESAAESNISDRVLKSNEDWAKPFLKESAESSPGTSVVPSYLEISFSNKCNFKCTYCSPSASSKWHEEIRNFGSYNLATGVHQDLSHFPPVIEEENNPYVEAFWKWFPDIYPQLRVLRITGGEPLLSPNTGRLLDYILSHPHPNLELSVNSNLGVPKNILDDFLEKLHRLDKSHAVQKVVLFTSVDTWGEQAEYIRHGLNFVFFWKNIEHILAKTERTSVTVMCTMNILSPYRLRALLANLLELKKRTTYQNNSRLHIDISYLRHPTFLSILLTDDLGKALIAKCLDFMKANEIHNNNPGFHPQETEKLARIHKLLEVPLEESYRKLQLKSFFQFIHEVDERRKTNFKNVFPEVMNSIYQQG